MPHSVALAVPQPCSESWAAMLPTAHGRHCAACNKVVVDFTEKTDAEILAALKQASTPCGRFRADQLNRTLLPAAAPAARWRTWLAAAATVWGLREAAASGAAAQQPSAELLPRQLRQTAVAPRPAEAVVSEAASGAGTVRGRVTDAATGAGLPGVAVLVAGTADGVSTGVDGFFQLSVSPQPINRQRPALQLAISYVGYFSQAVAVDCLTTAPIDIKLVADARMLAGEVVVVGGAVHQQPWP